MDAILSNCAGAVDGLLKGLNNNTNTGNSANITNNATNALNQKIVNLT
jgi:hypothetical protein